MKAMGPALFILMYVFSVSATVSDRAIEFESKGVKLHGTLQEPKENSPRAVIVFVHGSGPVNRDGISRAKPDDPPIFKQLSEFLVEKGYATFRFDKRTLTYDAKNPPWDKEKFSPYDLIEDVRSAISMVRGLPGYVDKKVFLLSHSEGGTFLPEVAGKDPKIAGLLLLSPPFQTLDRALFAQFYPQLEEVTQDLKRTKSPNEREKLEKTRSILEEKLLTNGVAMLGALRRNQTPSVQTYLGFSAQYLRDWMGLMDSSIYSLCELNQPFLVIGGEKDDQAPVQDWVYAKAACVKKNSGLFKKLPKLGHLLVTPKQKMSGEVEQEVIKFLETH